MILLPRLLILFFILSSQLFGFQESPCPKKHGFRLYFGPEIYHVHRTRDGKAKQNGTIYGIHGGYERIERYKFYFGFDALYAKGILDGKNKANIKLKSNFSDTYTEGRIGYTLQSKCGWKPLLTPYVGLGYFIEKNDFTHPKAIPVHFRTSYLYGALGFLSQISLTNRFDLGFNFKVKFPYDAKCRISHDPYQADSKQLISEKPQYRFELPMTYKCYENSDRLILSLVPFYELRCYGYHPNYPCDFLETRLDLYGAQLKLIYCF